MDKNIEEKKLKAETISYIINKLEKWFELVEPTDNLKKLKDIVGGDTIFDSVSNYIMIYGYTPEFSAMFVEQRQVFLKEKNKSVLQKCAENSLASLGAKAEKGKKGIKEFAKKHYKGAIAILIAAGMAVSVGVTLRMVSRENELKEAGQDIVTTFKEEYNYEEALSEIKCEDEYVRIPESDFHIFLLQHDFTRDEIIYLTNIYDKVSLNDVLNYYGYSYLDEFLCDYYFNPVYSGSENPVVLYKEPNYRKFENAVEESIKSKADLLKKYYDMEVSKGLGSR